MPGMHRNRVTDEKNATKSQAPAPFDPGPLYCTDQQLSPWLRGGQDLYWKLQGLLSARSELLFLSRCLRLLSHWSHSGSAGEQELSIYLLSHWFSHPGRRLSWTAGLRLALSLRTVSRSALSDSILSKVEEAAGGSGSSPSEIYPSGGFRDPAAYVCGGSGGTGKSLVLQVDLSVRHPDGRSSDSGGQRASARRSGLALCVEGSDPGSGRISLCPGLSPLLPLSLPLRGYLRSLQSIRSLSVPRGSYSLHQLWQLSEGL